jgi:hypothetical protein
LNLGRLNERPQLAAATSFESYCSTGVISAERRIESTSQEIVSRKDASLRIPEGAFK